MGGGYVKYTPFINIREIGYLTDSKKVTITTTPQPMEWIYGKFFWKNSKIRPPRASKIQAICPALQPHTTLATNFL